MADGRHLEKSKNRHISAAVQAISIKFGTQTQFDPLERPNRLKFKISKIQDGGGRPIYTEAVPNHLGVIPFVWVYCTSLYISACL